MTIANDEKDAAVVRLLGEWIDPGYGREVAWAAEGLLGIHLVDDKTCVAWRINASHAGWARHTWDEIKSGMTSLSTDEVLRCDSFGNWDGNDLAAPAAVDLLVLDGEAVAGEPLSFEECVESCPLGASSR